MLLENLPSPSDDMLVKTAGCMWALALTLLLVHTWRALTARSAALTDTSGCVRQGPGEGEWLCAYTDAGPGHLLSGPLDSVSAASTRHTAGEASYFELNHVRGKPWCSGSIRAQD